MCEGQANVMAGMLVQSGQAQGTCTAAWLQQAAEGGQAMPGHALAWAGAAPRTWPLLAAVQMRAARLRHLPRYVTRLLVACTSARTPP